MRHAPEHAPFLLRMQEQTGDWVGEHHPKKEQVPSNSGTKCMAFILFSSALRGHLVPEAYSPSCMAVRMVCKISTALVAERTDFPPAQVPGEVRGKHGRVRALCCVCIPLRLGVFLNSVFTIVRRRGCGKGCSGSFVCFYACVL